MIASRYLPRHMLTNGGHITNDALRAAHQEATRRGFVYLPRPPARIGLAMAAWQRGSLLLIARHDRIELVERT